MYNRTELAEKRADVVTAMLGYKDVRGEIGEREAIALANALHLGIGIGIGIAAKSEEENPKEEKNGETAHV